MTYAQKYYKNTSQRDFAFQFKNLAPFLQEELNIIHKIQCNDPEKEKIIIEYEKKYGPYELDHKRKSDSTSVNDKGQITLF
jgi:hypothetical protein